MITLTRAGFAESIIRLRSEGERGHIIDWCGGELRGQLLDEMLMIRDENLMGGECGASDWCFLLPALAKAFTADNKEPPAWKGVEFIRLMNIPTDCEGVWGMRDSPGPYTYVMLVKKNVRDSPAIAASDLVTAVNVGIVGGPPLRNKLLYASARWLYERSGRFLGGDRAIV